MGADVEAWSSDHVEALNKELVEMIGASIRGDDLVGRLGGRVVMVLNDASADDARGVGDRICAAVRTHRFGNGGEGDAGGAGGAKTLSIGAAAAPDHGQSYEAVLDAALAASPEFSRKGATARRRCRLHTMTH